ncbi:MAG TPA: PIN domain-containing protein [Bryobacteraceae bacterium]|jgi:predicted nucleic acid-binding protein
MPLTDVAFFDTNILLYIHDHRDPVKQRRAAEIFEQHLVSKTIAISTQVIQEFYVTATRKFSLPPERAREVIADFCEMKPVTIDTPQILQATDLAAKFHLSFWDALILAAAETAGATLLLSEDFSPGQVYGRIRVVNPLLPS